jgi:hypothetical protein
MSSPVVFISYSHDSLLHKDRILNLSNKLRKDGVDCMIDQYEQSPTEGWPLWCERQVEHATFVLVVCSKTYCLRFRKDEEVSAGLGAAWEGHLIRQELYNSQSSAKFIPIVFDPGDSSFIPTPLQGFTHFKLNEDYDGLYRRLTNQPLIAKPVLGSVKARPPQGLLPPQPALHRQESFEQSAVGRLKGRRTIKRIFIAATTGMMLIAGWLVVQWVEKDAGRKYSGEAQHAAQNPSNTANLQLSFDGSRTSQTTTKLDFVDNVAFVTFYLVNTGNTATKNGYMNIQLCNNCFFESLPDPLFETSKGDPPKAKMFLPVVSPGSYLQVGFSLRLPAWKSDAAIQTWYMCDTCGRGDHPQTAKIIAVR